MVTLFTVLAGCMAYLGITSGQVSSADVEPFITDRVVEVRIVMSDEDWEKCKLDALLEEYVQADFWFDGELIPDVAVRPKGNSSLYSVYRSGSIRLSFKVDFNFFNSARNFRGLKKVNLNNGFHDPTLMREHLSYEIYDRMGLPSPRTAFVDLWVNDTHMGLYTEVEQVDVTFLARHFSDTSGNLYKPEPQAGYLAWTQEDLQEQREKLGFTEPDDTQIMQQINMGGANLAEIIQVMQEESQEEDADKEEQTADAGQKNIRANLPQRETRDYTDQMGLKTNEAFPDHTALFNFLEILNNEPDETFPEKIEEVLDVDSALRFIAVAGTIGNFDSFIGNGHNYYLYEVDGKFTIIPWDLNGSFGAFNHGMTREDIVDLYIDQPTSGPITNYPVVDRLLSHPPYLEKYHQYLKELVEDHFSVDRMKVRIHQTAELIRPYVYADELKFYTNADFEKALKEDIPRAEEGGMPAENGNPPRANPAPPVLPEEIVNCLENAFSRSILEELKVRKPDNQELAKLKECLDPMELDIFLGKRDFQASQPGMVPGNPPSDSIIAPDSLECVQSKFDLETLDELKTRRPTLQELNLLKTCLTREEMAVFLRQSSGVVQPQMTVSTYPGLETLVIERTHSIQLQLSGQQPSKGDGSGNSSMNMKINRPGMEMNEPAPHDSRVGF